MLALCVLRSVNTPRRRALRKLQLLSQAKGAQAEAAQSTHKRLAPQLSEFLIALSGLPIIRLLTKTLAEKIEEKQAQVLRESCMNDLPEMVDILSLSMGAGLSVDQSFEWYLSSYDTPLAGQIRQAEQAYQVGMLSRIRAFEQLAQSLQEEAVLRFVNALRQAFTLGAPLGPALAVLSHELRSYRVVRIEERIAKTSVKILAPLGLCIVPAVLILLMGPVMSQVMAGFAW